MKISYIYSAIIIIILSLLVGCSFSKEKQANKIQTILVVPLTDKGLILPIIIKNKLFSFLLDTGASYSAIDNKLASVLTSPTSKNDIPIYFQQFLTDGLITTNDKLNQFKLWQPLPISLGAYTIFGTDPWIGLDLSLLSQAIGQKIDGILGVEVFRQLSWAINNKNKTITVWNQAPSTLDYQNCIPYEDAYAQSPLFILNSKSKSNDLNFASLNVDTGADDTVISKELLNFWKNSGTCKLVLDRKGITGASASGLSTNKIYLIDCLVFDQMRVGNLRINVTKNKINKLGFDFFSRFDNYVFIPNKMQFCYNAKNFTRNDKNSLRHIKLAYFDGHIELRYNNLTDIVPYGLINGDILLSINNIKVTAKNLNQVKKLLNYTPKLKLIILRKRSEISIQI